MNDPHLLPPLYAAFLAEVGVAATPPVAVSANGSLLDIGRLGELPVWRVTGSTRHFGAEARRLARAGTPGLLLGRHPDHTALLAAVTLAPARTVILRTDALAPIARRLRRAVGGEASSPLGLAVALADALDLDAAGRRTFRLLHDLIESGIGHLPGTIPRADRHAWLLTQCTRLLFLRFVEAEGWLDHDTGFLLRHFDRTLQARRDPFRYYLQPLFFGTLNRPAKERLRVAREFGAIPFLNGGLFEPHPVEGRHRHVLPLEWWRNAFAALTERIEVTIDPEASGGEVTPEMLGRVFEGVMAGAERKDHGAFYTPAPLVRALVRSALVPHLAVKLSRTEAALDRALDDPDPVLRQALLQLRLLDPAVGSGAFLVGALDLLHGPGAREPQRVRQLVTRSLHGIDRHPGAVRITELRLWLEVLRPLRGATPSQIPPLPNLDAAVRAGDALLDPLRRIGVAGDLQLLARQQRVLGAAHGAPKRRLQTSLRRAEREALMVSLTNRATAVRRSIAELIGTGRTPTLFGEAAGLDHEGEHRLRDLRQEWHVIRRELRALLHDQSAVPFAPGIAFAGVMARGGFDLVVGNPPWVRAERLPAGTRQALTERYRWWRGVASRGYRHLPDLAVAFVERSLELVRPGGSMALLVPAKLATTQYATAMRAGLSQGTTLRCVADLADDPRASFDATTYPMALVATRHPPPPGHRVHLGLEAGSASVDQATLQEGTTWGLRAPEARAVARRLERQHPAVGDRIAAQLGVKTGANDLFLNPPAALEAWTRPALRGRDIAADPARTPDRLLWPADDQGAPWTSLPEAVAEYLAPHRRRLERRTDLHDARWWRLFRTTAATAHHRIAWGDLARDLRATSLHDPRVIPLNSCYVAVLSNTRHAAALSAWFNTSWLRALARLGADPAAQGYARFNARVVMALPLPAGVLDHPVLAQLGECADAMDQPRLDALAGDLLHLDDTDRALLAPLAAPRR